MKAVDVDRLKSDAAQALSKLEWPSDASMLPYVQRLLGAPGSCILIGLEFGPDGLILGRAWLSVSERAARKHWSRLTGAVRPKDKTSRRRRRLLNPKQTQR